MKQGNQKRFKRRMNGMYVTNYAIGLTFACVSGGIIGGFGLAIAFAAASISVGHAITWGILGASISMDWAEEQGEEK